ncbi:hypothetical protein CaCOL14_005330 [Colletotrichum acutatum]
MEDEGKVYEDGGRTMISGRFFFDSLLVSSAEYLHDASVQRPRLPVRGRGPRAGHASNRLGRDMVSDQHRPPYPSPRRGRDESRLNVLPHRRRQDRRVGLPKHQLLLLDQPRRVDLRRRSALAHHGGGRPGALPGRRASQGDLQQRDEEVRHVHAH